MGFVKDLAKVGTYGLAGLALPNKKKKVTTPRPSMISMSPSSTSMIGSSRGDY